MNREEARVRIVLTVSAHRTLPVSRVSVVKEMTSHVGWLPFTEKGRGKVVIVENPKSQLVLCVKDVSYVKKKKKKEKNFYCVPWKEN